jgi:hypothetical protein
MWHYVQHACSVLADYVRTHIHIHALLKLLLLYSFKRLALALILELPQVQNPKGTNIRGKLLTK